MRRRDRLAVERAMLLEAEEALQELRARLSVAEAGLESLSEGIVVLEPEGRISYMNAAARDLIGRRFDSVHELAPVVLRDASSDAMAVGESRELEFETAGRVVQAAIVGTEGAAGIGAILVLRDVTATRRGDRIRRDFVANASHELKTPVSSIAALAEALREAAGRDRPAMERFVTLLEEESRRLARLVDDLLDLSRLEGELPSFVPVDLGRVVTEETERLRPLANATGLRLTLLPAEDVKVSGSEGDLGLLVHNLLDNAIHYTPEGGDIRVALEADDVATLTISDTGIGIASRDLDRVFERFYRADPARSRETGGTGLGLSIVKHVAEAHGGDVEVQSVLGAGSTFTVRLPLADAGSA
jgi:two-component system sensor histidine kinase SenX3